MDTITITMTQHEAAYIHWILLHPRSGCGEARDNINSVTDALSPIASPWTKNNAMSYSRLDAELINVENWGLRSKDNTSVHVHTRLGRQSECQEEECDPDWDSALTGPLVFDTIEGEKCAKNYIVDILINCLVRHKGHTVVAVTYGITHPVNPQS